MHCFQVLWNDQCLLIILKEFSSPGLHPIFVCVYHRSPWMSCVVLPLVIASTVHDKKSAILKTDTVGHFVWPSASLGQVSNRVLYFRSELYRFVGGGNEEDVTPPVDPQARPDTRRLLPAPLCLVYLLSTLFP